MTNVFYETEWDDRGARVKTNVSNTLCARCKAAIEPNVEHLCGNRLTKKVLAIQTRRGRLMNEYRIMLRFKTPDNLTEEQIAYAIEKGVQRLWPETIVAIETMDQVRDNS